MKTRNSKAEDYVSGTAPLPPEFTTGYKRDLEIAREMVRLRRENQAPEESSDAGDSASLVRDVA